MAQIDYSAHLEMMWQKAIAPREPDAPTVISTFAGGGGSLTGYMMAGFRDLLSIEWDDNAVETLRSNWPDLDIYHGDIAKITVNEILQRTGLQPGELDILDGSPPCQGFSTAGKRMLDDPRNQLFREYVRLLHGLQPKVFIMENVSGMVKGKMKRVFVEILKELKASGYKVSAKLLNAMYFHVPQSRQRMIFIGVRDDLGIEPSHPKAESRPIVFNRACDGLNNNTGKPLNDFLQRMAIYQPVLWSSNPKVWRQLKGNLAGSLSTKWMVGNQVSGTLIKQWIAGTGIIHPNRERYINTAEAKRIASFPDDYYFPGRFEQSIERIGNSVPPLFMEAIARHVRTEILDRVPSFP
jgi:DNA (cytosine-5)-methyltransferase 1